MKYEIILHLTKVEDAELKEMNRALKRDVACKSDRMETLFTFISNRYNLSIHQMSLLWEYSSKWNIQTDYEEIGRRISLYC